MIAFVLICTKQFMVDLHCVFVLVTPSFDCICLYLYKPVYVILILCFFV